MVLVVLVWWCRPGRGAASSRALNLEHHTRLPPCPQVLHQRLAGAPDLPPCI